jgi:hypothetical protein
VSHTDKCVVPVRPQGGNSGSDDDGGEERRGFVVKREGALPSVSFLASLDVLLTLTLPALSTTVAVEAPRAPLIQYAVSMFGGAATGAVQVRLRPCT